MMERWTIEPSPTSRDPKRHTLFMKAEKLDVYAVLREFGALCGRPQKISKAPFNYSLVLHGAGPEDIQNVEKFLAALSGAEPAPMRASPAAFAQAPAETASPVPAPEAQEGAAASAEPASENGLRETGEPAAEPPAQAGAASTLEPAAEAAPVEGGPCQPLFGAALAADPLQTFDALFVGPFNRFAHAAGTAVVANPGSMYNPLILFGAPGVGKSHFLGAIGQSLSSAGGKAVFLTTGFKLSRAVAAAVCAGRQDELLSHAKESVGLLVDDVHLMAFSERNQAGLKSLFHSYLDAGKPIIMTSVYPPKALQFVEEALQFQIGSGYSVEVKLAGPETQLQILRSVMARFGLDAGEEEAKGLQGGLGHAFVELDCWLRRLKALEAIRCARKEASGLKDLLAALLSARIGAPAAPMDAGSVKTMLGRMPPLEPSRAPGSKTLGLVYPSGHEDHAQLMLLRFRDAAERGGLKLPVGSVAAQPFDPDQLFGVPLAIGEACERSGACAVLMLGPAPGGQLAAREGELRHALEHILGDLNMSLSLIPFLQAQDPNSYFGALLDLHGRLWASVA